MPSIISRTTFRVEELQRLRWEAERAMETAPGSPAPAGWAKSPHDPMALLRVFTSLRLRRGFVLRGYQYREGPNGCGVVWAMPADAGYPEPEACLRLADLPLLPPKPAEALGDVMEAIEGDGSAWSYVSASILKRELDEFGARWEASQWSNHVIIGQRAHDLLSSRSWPHPERHPFWLPAAVEWLEWGARDQSWEPAVLVEDDELEIAFYTVAELERTAIFRHIDRYRPGSYQFTPEVSMVAVEAEPSRTRPK